MQIASVTPHPTTPTKLVVVFSPAAPAGAGAFGNYSIPGLVLTACTAVSSTRFELTATGGIVRNAVYTLTFDSPDVEPFNFVCIGTSGGQALKIEALHRRNPRGTLQGGFPPGGSGGSGGGGGGGGELAGSLAKGGGRFNGGIN